MILDVGWGGEKGTGKRLFRNRSPLFLSQLYFLKTPSKKMSIIFAFWQGLWGPDGVNEVVKIALV